MKWTIRISLLRNSFWSRNRCSAPSRWRPQFSDFSWKYLNKFHIIYDVFGVMESENMYLGQTIYIFWSKILVRWMLIYQDSEIEILIYREKNKCWSNFLVLTSKTSFMVWEHSDVDGECVCSKFTLKIFTYSAIQWSLSSIDENYFLS